MASGAESPRQAALEPARKGEEPVFVEARWPVALAVGTFIAI